MFKKLLVLLVVIFFCNCLIDRVFALEWKPLHERADNETMSSALVFAGENKNSLESLYLLGLVYLNAYKIKEAQEMFEDILRRSPQAPEALWGLAEVYRRRHMLDESEKMLERIIREKPDYSPAYISLAYLRYTRKDFKSSMLLANKVIKQGSENVDLSNFTRAHLVLSGNKGMLAHYGGPLAKVSHGLQVFSYLKKAESLQPHSPAVYFGLGSFYLLAPSIAGGNLEKAEELLLETIRKDPMFTDAYVRLGQLYKVKGDIQKYQEYIDKALQIDPGSELALDIKNGTCDFICVSGKE